MQSILTSVREHNKYTFNSELGGYTCCWSDSLYQLDGIMLEKA